MFRDKQGASLLVGFGGLYPCPEIVEPILASQYNGEARQVLDVGMSPLHFILYDLPL
jgi:hypothetical protein